MTEIVDDDMPLEGERTDDESGETAAATPEGGAAVDGLSAYFAAQRHWHHRECEDRERAKARLLATWREAERRSGRDLGAGYWDGRRPGSAY